jgi:hypothetical protein
MTTALKQEVFGEQTMDTDLSRIVRINEEIKRVVGVSVKINIMALNAIFLAKRAGTAALGFGVLSNELRVFSQDLRNCMGSLDSLIRACVNQVSVGLQGIRKVRLLREAAVQSNNHKSIVAVLQVRETENEQRIQQLNRLRRQLKTALEEVFRMVELGGVLAKSAKIEAAYGQGFASSLSQVSGEFDKVVDEIHASLESLRRSAFFTGH